MHAAAPPTALSGRFTIAPDHPCLPGHFPGQPIVPGVVVIDAVLGVTGAAGWPAMRLPQVKFLQPLMPGREAQVSWESDGAGGWRFRVMDGEVLLATGALGPA